MTYRKNFLTGVTAAALLGAPLSAIAAPAELAGTIIESFDDRVIVETERGRLLVVPGDDAGQPLLEPGARVIVEGDLEGRTMSDAVFRPDPSPAPAVAPRPDTAAATPPAPGAGPGAGRLAGPAADLPAELAGLYLRDIRDRTDRDGEREIRALLPNGSRFEAEYDQRGRLEEIKTEPRAELPQPVLGRLLPGPVAEAARDAGMVRIHEVDFGDDREIEIKGHDDIDTPVEMEVALDGRVMELERKNGPGERGRPTLGIAQPELEQIARDAGYTEIGRVELRPRHAEIDATNPDGEPVRIRVDDRGQVTREERR